MTRKAATKTAPSREVQCTLVARGGERAAALVREATGLAHSVAKGLFDHGCVERGGTPCDEPGAVLAAGERLSVRYDPARRYRTKARPRPGTPFRLVYEDPYLVVVDKAPGVLTLPNHGERDTLTDAVRQYLGRGQRRAPRVFVVHRLDRETSGLLVIARTPDAAHALKAQFAARKPERLYHAVVAGRVEPEQGTFRSNLATDPTLNQRSTSHPEAGKPAVTHYRVTDRTEAGSAPATAVEVRLETGRRNQIRVHFSEAGHPVLGDPRYAPGQARHPLWKVRRMALHAAVLGFAHPVTGKPLRFASPPPPEFAALFRGAPAGPAVGRERRGRRAIR